MRNGWLLALLLAAPVAMAASSTDLMAVSDAYLQGVSASATVADSWEAALTKNPDQPAIRESLISYYNMKRFNESSAKALYAKHILYVIAQYPESLFAGSNGAFYLIPGVDNTADCAAADKLWLAQVDAHPSDIRILVNAANFLQFGDKSVPERLLKQAQKIEPKNPELHAQLGRFYLNQTQRKDLGAKYAAASKAFAEMETARKLTPDENGKMQLMDALVRSSYMIDRFDKTNEYADEWMKKSTVGSPNYSRAQHYSHSALGLIALKSKDLKSARDHLAMAADHNGSPDLNSFGPCMDLAAALMAQGQKDAVADYLEACGKFWKSGEKKLAEWNKVVEAGLRPDFTGHFSF